jgi:hypothetical protein
VLTHAHYGTVSLSKHTQSKLSQIIYLKCVLIVSFHLHIGLSSGLLLSAFLSKTLYAFLTLTYVLYGLATSLYLNRSLSYIIYQTVIMSTPLCKKLPRWIMKTNKSLSHHIYFPWPRELTHDNKILACAHKHKTHHAFFHSKKCFFSSLQHNSWHSCCKRMQNLL